MIRGADPGASPVLKTHRDDDDAAPCDALGGAADLDGYVVEDQAGFLLRRAHQRHAALFISEMAAADLTPMQFTALVKTVELGRVTQNQLGRLAAMDPATIQGVVKRLVARGLLARDADAADRRAIVLTPTTEGCALATQAVHCARRITDATLSPLAEAERTLFLSFLRRLS